MQVNMKFLVWIVLLTNLLHADSHMLHYLHLKKFLTAVAFARALGKRPTILPIPVPIPIPIAQNEVIKIPIAGGGKTMILDGNKGESKGVGISQLLGSGTSPYGYSIPGMSSLKASDSHMINLASTLGASNGSPRIIVLGGDGNGPSIIRMNDLAQLGTGAANPDFGFGLIHNVHGKNGDLDSSFSVKHPFVYERPYNVYSDKSRRKIALKFRGRRTYNNLPGPTFHHQKYNYKPYDNRYTSTQLQSTLQSFTHGKQKKPIPVGEKFTYRS